MASHYDQMKRGYEMTVDDVISALLESVERLPEEIEAALAMQGARLAPRLFALVREELAAPGTTGWGAIHAVRSFGEDRFVPAVSVLLETIASTDPDEHLHDAAIVALGRIGPPAAPSILAALERVNDDERDGLLCALADTRHPDSRVLPLLLEQLGRNPILGAGNLVDYGDVSALPKLSAALDAMRPPDSSELSLVAGQEIIDVAAAIEDLGGALSPMQAEKLEIVRNNRQAIGRLLDRVRESEGCPAPVHAAAKVGRNAPCWCGSGRKYKKCHLAEDERGG
jgi:HEAT repeat protein